MLTKTITYTDYNDVERTEEFMFNLSKAELIEMELGTAGGLTNYYQKIVNAKDVAALMKEFKGLIFKAYGEKSADGKRFIKKDELSDAFMQTEAYSILLTELVTDANAAAAFFNGIVPADLRQNLDDPNALPVKHNNPVPAPPVK